MKNCLRFLALAAAGVIAPGLAAEAAAAPLPATDTAWVASLPVDARQKIRIEAAYNEFLKGNGEQFFLAVAQDGSRWAYRVSSKELPAANARRDALASCQLTGKDTGDIHVAGPCVMAVIDGRPLGPVASLPLEAGLPQPGEELDWDKVPFLNHDRINKARYQYRDVPGEKYLAISDDGHYNFSWSGTLPRDRVMKFCLTVSKTCFMYAYGNTITFN